MLVYKVFRKEEYQNFIIYGKTNGSLSDKSDGYIHLSTKAQLSSTLEKYFKVETGLYLIAIDATKHKNSIRWEQSRNNELFPHLYCTLTQKMITWTKPLIFVDGIHQVSSRQ